MNERRREMLKCFGRGMNLPLWQGVMLLIREKVRVTMAMARVPELPDKELHMLIGGVSALEELKEEMEKAEAEAARG